MNPEDVYANAFRAGLVEFARSGIRSDRALVAVATLRSELTNEKAARIWNIITDKKLT